MEESIRMIQVLIQAIKSEGNHHAVVMDNDDKSNLQMVIDDLQNSLEYLEDLDESLESRYAEAEHTF